MAKVDLNRLPGLILLTETSLDNVSPTPSLSDRESWQPYYRQFRQIIAALEEQEGATYRPMIGSASRLKLAGLSVSCTGGDAGLLHNWIAAARRHLQPIGPNDR